MIRIAAAKISRQEKNNAAAAALQKDSEVRQGSAVGNRKEEIPLNRRLTDTREEDWVEHETEKGAILYSPQYSDDCEIFRYW